MVEIGWLRLVGCWSVEVLQRSLLLLVVVVVVVICHFIILSFYGIGVLVCSYYLLERYNNDIVRILIGRIYIPGIYYFEVTIMSNTYKYE